ncbi:hypothetical protein ABPG77_006820 [Micractinium sp. CCAP 211/92]
MQRVLFVRHAQCEMNLHVTERIGGRTNHSLLTPLGEAQAAALGAHLRAELAHMGVQPHRVRVFSSTAVRAVDTARHVLAALQLDPSCLVQSERLLELEQGEWEGAVRRECYTPELTARFAADPWGLAWNFSAPGGESQRQVEARMLAYLAECVLPGLEPGDRAIVVSHGMAIKCLLRGILNSLPSMSRNISMGNTAITEVGFVPRKGGGSSGSSNGSTEATAAAAAAAGHGGVSPGPLGEGTWHVLRVNDLSRLSYDLRS